MHSSSRACWSGITGINRRCLYEMFGHAESWRAWTLCMESLDFESEGVWRRVGPAMKHLAHTFRGRSSLEPTLEGCCRPRMQEVELNDSFGPPGWRCTSHGSRGPCNVDGCSRTSCGKVYVDDSFGPAGYRCHSHGARMCNILGSRSSALNTLLKPNKLGPAGRRCFAHCPKQAQRFSCSVQGCCRRPIRHRPADAHGPAGLRCCDHGGRHCTAPGCHKSVCRKHRQLDKHGPPGYRCSKHGGRQCTALHCTKVKTWGMVHVADNYGPPGFRCSFHGGVVCNVAGCQRSPERRLTKADKLGAAGWRCRVHNGWNPRWQRGSKSRLAKKSK